MREDFIYPHEMFDISANGKYCGVFVPTHVMKKFIRISAKWSAEIQKLFNENKDELLVASWNGVFPKDDNGNIIGSEYVQYSDPNGESWDTVEARIGLFRPQQPQHCDVYLCDRDTAKGIAQEIYDEKHKGGQEDETGK